VTESEEHIADVNSRPSSSEDISPILYVGSPSLGLTNLLLTHPTTPVCVLLAPPLHATKLTTRLICHFKVHGYDPVTREAALQSADTNKLLMRRYAIVQKARDADVFGILVGTLGVGSPPKCLLPHLSLS
jgi:diphthamide biosynthesis protein 2